VCGSPATAGPASRIPLSPRRPHRREGRPPRFARLVRAIRLRWIVPTLLHSRLRGAPWGVMIASFLPASLKPIGIVSAPYSSLHKPPALLNLVTMQFEKWPGPQPAVARPYERKPVLTARGRAAFAELAVLWLLHDAGWHGVWVDMFGGGKCLHDFPGTPAVTLEPHAMAVLAAISPKAKLPVPGTWDLFCWNSSSFLFIEVKHQGHDPIQESQLEFRDHALASHALLEESFIVVEWEFSRQLKFPGM